MTLLNMNLVGQLERSNIGFRFYLNGQSDDILHY